MARRWTEADVSDQRGRVAVVTGGNTGLGLETARVLRPLTWGLLKDARIGALASVRAAVDPAACGGDFFGPPGRAQFTGHPVTVTSSPRSYDVAAAPARGALRGIDRRDDRCAGTVDEPVTSLKP